MKMKNFLAILLIAVLALALVSCETRENQEQTPAIQTGEENLTEAKEPEGQTEPEKPENKFTPEEISSNISIAAKLLENAEKCDVVYRGLLETDKAMPQTTDGENEYFLVVSDLYDSSDIEKLWTSTFVLEGRAKEAYEQMVDDKLYMNFNGELHVKSHEAETLPPLTMGKWDITTAKLVSIADNKIVLTMETQLVGQPNGEKELTLISKDDSWILGESYFLD